MTRPCWCGNVDLEKFSDAYRICHRCGSLVSTYDHGGDVSRVGSDDVDFYGRDYWFGHMEKELGFANIYQRARSDLTERCPYWLKTVLKYKTPPGRVLEIGSAHGGFVAMLRWAGFDATGLELSPAITSIARDLFHVPMLQGPVEDQEIEAGTLDVIALMDVLEHLPDPVQTMRHCVRLLKREGFLLIQTPKYPDGKRLEAMRDEGDRFVELLKEQEHLYLFSARSVVRLFADLGCNHVSFEPALFGHYDMFLAVSREALVPIETARQEERVMQAETGRLVLALLDVSSQLQLSTSRFLEADEDRVRRLAANEQVQRRLAESEADRQARLADIERLQALLAESEADRAARLQAIGQLRRPLEESEGDRHARLMAMERLQALLAQSEADRAPRLQAIETLETRLAESGADCAARLEAIAQLRRRLEESEDDRHARLMAMEQLQALLAESEADRAARLQNMEALTARIDELEHEHQQLGEAHRRLESRFQSVSAAFADVSTRTWVRIGRQLGLLKDQ